MPTTEILDIKSLAPGGEGVGKCENGEVCFVAATAPGDRIEVGQFARQSGALRGQLLRVVEASKIRRDPPCPYAGQCGGCDFMHLEPTAQRQLKLELLDESLQRVGGNPPRAGDVQFVASAKEQGYRSRLRLHVDQQGQVGFLSPRSHRVVPVERCLVADPTINRALERLAAADARAKKRLSFCEQVELRSAEATPTLAVRLIPRKKIQLQAELYAPLFPDDAVVVVADTDDDHQRTQTMPVSTEVTLSVPLSAFSQVNREVNRELVHRVVLAALQRDRRTFLDAYAGAGNFALPLLKAGLTGVAIDSDSAGILAARARARDLGLPFTGFDVGDARRLIEHLVKGRRQFDYIVLDPPRHGSKDVLEAVLGLRPRTIAFVSCDPVALARDLSLVTAHGGRIESLTVLDMFPETHHFETLAIVDCDG